MWKGYFRYNKRFIRGTSINRQIDIKMIVKEIHSTCLQKRDYATPSFQELKISSVSIMDNSAIIPGYGNPEDW